MKVFQVWIKTDNEEEDFQFEKPQTNMCIIQSV